MALMTAESGDSPTPKNVFEALPFFDDEETSTGMDVKPKATPDDVFKALPGFDADDQGTVATATGTNSGQVAGINRSTLILAVTVIAILTVVMD